MLNSRAVHQGQPRRKRGLRFALVGALELISARPSKNKYAQRPNTGNYRRLYVFTVNMGQFTVDYNISIYRKYGSIYRRF